MKDFVVVIPARYKSSRFPGKPLVSICGVPMVVRTWRQCAKAVPADSIVVATEDERIVEVCRQYGIEAVITTDNCLTGTDRVAEVAEQIAARSYINVQGDEPIFNPQDILNLVEAAGQSPDDVINGYCEIDDEEDYVSRSTPKVVFRPDGRLLYMSRAPIPGNKDGKFRKAYRQVCAYAYSGALLKAFSSQKDKTFLEQNEDIELLRFLEMGYEIRMIPMSSLSVPVDNPEDVEVAEARIRELEQTAAQ